MDKEVWIIGVHPPCPRCDLTRQRVDRITQELGLSLDVRTMVYSDLEVKKFGESIGKEIGTAKHVAQKAGLNMDWDRVSAVVKNPPNRPEDFDKIDGRAKAWSPEMDEALRPCQEKAVAVDMLMTPILVVQGEVRHQGSVPSIKMIKSWLSE